ncbi:MAG: trigger factor [Bdellovibrionia bacterium]
MEFSLEVEKPSSILRKLKIKIPANVVKNHFEKGLAEVQKTAKIKGFRPGQVPMTIVKQYYGEDVRHQVFHRLIDNSVQEAVQGQKIQSVGSPKIETPDHKTGEGEHDHTLSEDKDLSFTATIEVMPDVQVKGYKKLKIKQEKVEITDAGVEKVVENLRNSQAELTPVVAARPVAKGDFVDTQILGGLVKDGAVEAREDMKGSKVIEIGSNAWIPGFEENLIGMQQGDHKTFRLNFPADFVEKELAGLEAEFTVTINEIKEKKLAPLDDEFAKQLGYEDLKDLRTKARAFLLQEKTQESDKNARTQLLSTLIEKNPFEVPRAMVEAQTRILAQDWAQELKKQNFDDKAVESIIKNELDELMKRAQTQVMASLVLESVAKQESVVISPEDIATEITKLSASMKVEEEKLHDFYAKNSGRKGDLEFRLRQERTIKFLLDNAEITSVAASEK